MSETSEDKGFKVVDRRSSADPAGEAGADPPAAQQDGPAGGAATATASGPAAGEGVPAPSPGFLDLVRSLQFGAMMSLGMVQGPDGKRSPVDLAAARDAIDILDVLKEKTKGNLTAEEDGVLAEGLYVLQMGFLAARNAGSPPDQGGGER
jgi:hypothetical protein